MLSLLLIVAVNLLLPTLIGIFVEARTGFGECLGVTLDLVCEGLPRLLQELSFLVVLRPVSLL